MLVTEEPDGGSMPGSASPELLEARIRGLQHALGQLLENAQRLTQGEHQRAVRLHRQLQEQTAIARRESRALVDAKTAEALSEAEPKARLLADRLAPGLGSIPPNDARWRSRQLVGAGVPSYVRVGELDAGTPVVAPLLQTNGHPAPDCHSPAEVQVCGKLPLHPISPGRQTPEQTP